MERAPGCLPEASPLGPTAAVKEEWKMLFALRDAGLAQLDKLTRSVVEGQKQQGQKSGYKSVDAEVIYHVDEETRRRLEPYGVDLEDLVGAGYHSFAAATGATPAVELLDRRGEYAACAAVGSAARMSGDGKFPDLSARDAAAVRMLRGHRTRLAATRRGVATWCGSRIALPFGSRLTPQ